MKGRVMRGFVAFGLISGCTGVVRASSGALPDVAVYERSSQFFANTEVLLSDDAVYLPVRFLVDSLGMKRRALPGERIGLCRGEVCIPFSVGAGPRAIQRVGENEYVPAEHLVTALGGPMVWHAPSRELLMSLERRPLAETAESDAPVDFTLPDLQGRPISLSDFRGKKVVLFAWASW